jgi:hypothetical protein
MNSTLFAQSSINNKNEKESYDLALVSCVAVWGDKGTVTVTWTVRNDGQATCPLIGKREESLVSYIVDGSSEKSTAANANDWSRLADSSPLVCLKKELRPGDTATGSFTFNVSDQKKELVSYKVTLSSEWAGCVDINKENNIYIGGLTRR